MGIAGFDGTSVTREPAETRWVVGFGHRRLSIIDLSDAASQPMVYRDRYWLTYNGEVYNYVELRAELEKLGHVFRSRADSEVILAAFAEWGPACFARFRGMWGLAIFDAVNEELTLSRDHLGIKPLYLWRRGEMLVAVSEIKQLTRVPGFTARHDEYATSEYLQTGYEDESRTLFQGVSPVPPGTYLQIAARRRVIGEPVAYWSPENITVSVTSSEDASERFAEKFAECVRIHLRSDVPVGCALSGGLDSSAIAVLIDRNRTDRSEPLHTFTKIYPGEWADERAFAEGVIRAIDATPHFIQSSPEGFLRDLNAFVWQHDEPVGGLSLYAGYCVARETRAAQVPVTLNGQGGDEILSAYWQLYFLYLRELALRGRMFSLAAHMFGALLRDGNPALVNQVPLMLRRYRARRRGGTLVPLRGSTAPVAGAILRQMLAVDGQARRVLEIRKMFLPRLLKWEDRNSMAFSVEGRYPLLDRELIELCLSFSPELLYYRGWTKWPLRKGLQSLLPEEIAWRRSKFGFEVPQDRWLCGRLRPALEEWLEADRPLWQHVEREDVRKLAEETWRLDGREEEPGQALFRCFMFDRWLELFDVQ